MLFEIPDFVRSVGVFVGSVAANPRLVRMLIGHMCSPLFERFEQDVRGETPIEQADVWRDIPNEMLSAE